MFWIQIVDKNETKQKCNTACTLSVVTSKDNEAIHPTCTCTRFCIARNTVWTELLHTYQLHPWLFFNSALRTGFREQEQHKQLIRFVVFITTSLQKLHSCRTKTGTVTYRSVLHVSFFHDSFQQHRLSDWSLCTHLRFSSPWQRRSALNTTVLVHEAHMLIYSYLNTSSARSKIFTTTGYVTIF